MLYLFLNIIMKMLEFTFLNPNIYYRTDISTARIIGQSPWVSNSSETVSFYLYVSHKV